MSSLRRLFDINLPSRRLIGERWRARKAVVNPRPLFVFGNQKSGTTALAGLLAEATGQTVTLDFAGAWGRRAQALIGGRTPIAEFVRRNAWAFSAAIVKEPNLTFAAPQLMQHFPQSRGIFVVRDPCANIRSIVTRLKLPGTAQELSRKEWRRIGPNWRMILRGEDIAVGGDNHIEILARRWMRALDMCDKIRDRVRVVRYEDFNADKTGLILALAHEFSLPVTGDISQSLNRDFQPRAPAEWSPMDFFGPRNLDCIARICAGRASAFGYRIG